MIDNKKAESDMEITIKNKYGIVATSLFDVEKFDERIKEITDDYDIYPKKNMKYNQHHGPDGRFVAGGGSSGGGGGRSGGGSGSSTQEQLFAMGTSWSGGESNGVRYDSIYTAQSHIETHIVNSKISNGDFDIYISRIDDGGESINILVDGNHSLQAAIITNTQPTIHIVNQEGGARNLEEYVSSFGDLSNPVNIVTGRDLW